MVWIEVFVLLVVAIYLLYRWATLNYRTFAERGIPYHKPWPLVGNSVGIVFNKVSFLQEIIEFYKQTKAHKVHGYFNFRHPIFVINDPELIKKITVKDFDHFPNHAAFFDTNNEILLESMLTIMKDQRWKDMRNTLTPVFTTAKMRSMFVLMNECFAESLKYLEGLSTGGEGFELEMKQCFTRLSNDIIASTAFGLKINSYVDQDNEFYRIGQSITNFRGKQMFKFFLSNAAPKLMQLFGIKLFDPAKTSYFVRLVVNTMKYREEHNIVRPDMIQLLMESKKESEQHWSDEELVAQCFIFFFAAFENNAVVICTTCHELMLNPDIQQRLYEEAVEMRDQLDGKHLNYDDVAKLKYMDMVLSESLRKWALAPIIDRVCSKDYDLKDDDDQMLVQFKAGDRLWFPLAGLQCDAKYFKDPELFDPERFSDENKPNIQPYTYLPFGSGPRNCIGNRYALMQAKAMLYYLLLAYKLERASKTVPDLMADVRGFQVNPANGFWLKLVPRK